MATLQVYSSIPDECFGPTDAEIIALGSFGYAILEVNVKKINPETGKKSPGKARFKAHIRPETKVEQYDYVCGEKSPSPIFCPCCGRCYTCEGDRTICKTCYKFEPLCVCEHVTDPGDSGYDPMPCPNCCGVGQAA